MSKDETKQRFHVVCHECPYEHLRGNEQAANNLTVAHANADSHDVEYAQIQ